MAQALEITVYTHTNRHNVTWLYCEDCKPQGGQRGTLMNSSYDHFCHGCGEDFREMAERKVNSSLVIHPMGPNHRILEYKGVFAPQYTRNGNQWCYFFVNTLPVERSQLSDAQAYINGSQW